MIGADVRWPVLFREKVCADSLAEYESQGELLAVLSEFHDILEEFEAWDAAGRRLQFLLRPSFARLIKRRRCYSVPEDFVGVVVSDEDPEGLRAAMTEFCTAQGVPLQPSEGEPLIRFWKRIAPHRR